jgi:hypothetical protein
MTQTTQTVVKAQVIWDGGWYVRLRLNDGQERDNSFTARRDIGLDRARKEARKEARSWGFAMPSSTLVEIVR